MDGYRETERVRQHLNKHRILVLKGEGTLASLSLFCLSFSTSLAGTDEDEACARFCPTLIQNQPNPQ